MVDGAEERDWSGVSEQMARQIVAQGELFMQAQLQAGIAADQRATTLASIAVTLSAALLAGCIAYWDATEDIPILIAGLCSSLTLLAAAALAFWAARPVAFYFPGNQPEQWHSCRLGELSEALAGEAENYQQRIDANALRLRLNAAALKWSGVTASAAPALGLSVWVAFTLFLSPQASIPPALSCCPCFQLQWSLDASSHTLPLRTCQ